RDAYREVVGVQRGMTHHRQYFSGARVQCDCRTRTRPQGLLRDLLQVVIDGKLNLFAGNGFLSGQALHFFAYAVYDDEPHAVSALKQVVVLVLQAGLSGEVAGAELAVTRFDLLFADFTDVARSMSEEAARQVSPAGDGNHFQDRNVRAMRFDEVNIRPRGVGFDDNRLEFRQILSIRELVPQIIQRDSQTVRNAREILFHESWLVAKEEHAERRPVVHQHAAVEVQHSATRRNVGNVAHPVAIRT